MKKCSKCKEEKNLYEFTKNKSQLDGMQKYCKKCKKSSDEKWIMENPSIWKERNKIKNQKIKNILSEFRVELGGKCIKCNESREHLLDFHHIEPKKKEGVIADILGWSGFGENAIKKARNELNKCILLCSNCHRDFHFLEKDKNININQYISSVSIVGDAPDL